MFDKNDEDKVWVYNIVWLEDFQVNIKRRGVKHLVG